MEEDDIAQAIETYGKSYAIQREKTQLPLPGGEFLDAELTFPSDLEKDVLSPLIYSSHGVCMSAAFQRHLADSAARRGFTVVAPDHNDFFNAGRIKTPDARFCCKINKEDWKNYAYEAFTFRHLFGRGIESDDVAKFCSGRLEEARWMIKGIEKLIGNIRALRQVDRNRVGFVGYSLGGWEAIEMAAEFEFNVMGALSPASMWNSKETIQKHHGASVYMSGTYDALWPGKAFYYANAPKAFISILNGGHYIFAEKLMAFKVGIPFVSAGESGFEGDSPLPRKYTEVWVPGERDIEVKGDFEIEEMDLRGVGKLECKVGVQTRNYGEKAKAINKGLFGFLKPYLMGEAGAYEEFDALKGEFWYDRFKHVPKKAA
ncbi:MAG: hypothetical protein V1740_01730 [Candidatus Woesearchaeota archaeon]